MVSRDELIAKCYAKADRLERRASRIKDVLGSMTAAPPRKYIGREEAYDRLVENNRRQGISPGKVYTSATWNDGLELGKLYDAISKFAEKGDPLAQKLLDYSREKGTDQLYALNVGELIIERMITRTLTENEYNRLLTEEFKIPF